jgi:hypothetical protein
MRSRRNPCGTGPDPIQGGQVVRRRTQGPGIIYRRACPADKSPTQCPAPCAKIFRFTFDPNHLFIYRHPAPARGAYRDRHGRWARGCDGRRWRVDEGAYSCGRRSRMVLTPRRWCQVGESNFADDGGKKARSPGRVRRKPLKPSRREGRVFRWTCGD